MTHPTKQRLLDAGMAMLLQQGYHDMGIQALLKSAGTPRGSFYHHFEDKEDFALQAIDQYMGAVHVTLDECLGDEDLEPLLRVRRFFEMVQESYREEGYLGCLLGGLGQELSGISEVFRLRIDTCIADIAGRLEPCLDLARERGAIPAGTDTQAMASLLTDCWEGAALRSRLKNDPGPLTAMLDFFFGAASPDGTALPRR